MPHARLANDEIIRIGKQIYQQRLRNQLEEGNEGKILVIDVETGDYELDVDEVQAVQRARAVHPDHAFCMLRVGYDAVHSFGPRLKPSKR